mgnify:CR=1 FL=1
MTKLMPKHINGVELPKQLREFANQALKDHSIRELAVAFLANVKTALSQSSSQVTTALKELAENTTTESKAVSASAAALIERAIERLNNFSTSDNTKQEAPKKKKAKSAKAKSGAKKPKAKKSTKSSAKPKSKAKAKPTAQPAQ